MKMNKSTRGNRLWYGRCLDDYREVGFYVNDGAKRITRTFASAKDAANFIKTKRPEHYSVYWLVDGVWTTEGCPPLPD